MSTITKTRTNFRSVFKSLFSSEVDINEYEDKKLPEELNNVLKSLKTKEDDVERAINVVNNSSKKGGLNKKINPIKDANTEKAMRAMHKEVKQNSVEDKERE